MTVNPIRRTTGRSASVIDKIHPQTLLITTFAIVLFVTLVHKLTVLIAILIGVLWLVWISRLTWSDLRHRVLHIEGFMLVLMVLLPFTVPGQTLIILGPFVATFEGVQAAVKVAIKVNICAVAAFALLGSLDPVRVARAAEDLGVPTRFVTLFLFTARYVSVFRVETARLTEAMRVRAFRPRSNLHTWHTYGNLVGMMLVRSLERARRVDEAMRCRGFTGQMPTPPIGAVGQRDLVFTATLVSVMVSLFVMDRVL